MSNRTEQETIEMLRERAMRWACSYASVLIRTEMRDIWQNDRPPAPGGSLEMRLQALAVVAETLEGGAGLFKN